MYVCPSAPGIKGMGRGGRGPREAQMAAILQLSQYCTFTRDSISTVITEPGQPVSHRGPSTHCQVLPLSSHPLHASEPQTALNGCPAAR